MLDPPDPVQVSTYEERFLVGVNDSDPEIFLTPFQSSDAVHEVAFVTDHVIFVCSFLRSVVGVAEIFMVGGGIVDVVPGAFTATVTNTVFVVAPPLPEQVIL